MTCSVCGKEKHSISSVKSSILPTQILLICSTCKDSGLEPRWLVILVARAHGAERVTKHLKKHLYFGNPILADELV